MGTDVRTSVPIFLKIRALEFSDFLYWKMKKMSKKVTFSLFHRKFENGLFLAKNGPKLGFLAQIAQKWCFFTFFSKTAHWNFLIFCRKPSLWSRKKMTVLVFRGNFKNGPLWPKLTQIWPKFGHYLAIWDLKHGCSKKDGVKNFEIFLFFLLFFFSKSKKKLFQAKKIHILPLWTPLWLPSAHT